MIWAVAGVADVENIAVRWLTSWGASQVHPRDRQRDRERETGTERERERAS